MKIVLAQIPSAGGDIGQSTGRHLAYISKAIEAGADIIAFPELSLTGYEPTLARDRAFATDDPRLTVFQQASDLNAITICIGLPTRGRSGIFISMAIFQPAAERRMYSKRVLHPDEMPYFVAGTEQAIFRVKETVIAPAICYESLQPEHAEASIVQMKSDLYLASVAKSANGLTKAFQHYPTVARNYAVPVLMVNCVGRCDDFISNGASAVWNKNGELVGCLGNELEGALVYDDENESCQRI